jgi:hypothetical protein
VLLLDCAHQIGLGTEVIADRGVVALAGRLADLPVRHGEHAVLGVQPFGGLQYCLLRAAGTIGAHGPGGGHLPSQRRSTS